MKVKLRDSPLGSRVLADQERGILLFDGRVPVAIFGISTFASLLRAVEKLFGEAAPTILYMLGQDMGRSFAQQFVSEVGDPTRSLELLSEIDAMAGWGKYVVTSFDPQRKEATIVMRNSFIADALKPSNKPVCHLLSGYFAGILSFVFGTDVVCEEVECAAKGDSVCKFVIRPSG